MLQRLIQLHAVALMLYVQTACSDGPCDVSPGPYRLVGVASLDGDCDEATTAAMAASGIAHFDALCFYDARCGDGFLVDTVDTAFGMTLSGKFDNGGLHDAKLVMENGDICTETFDAQIQAFVDPQACEPVTLRRRLPLAGMPIQ